MKATRIVYRSKRFGRLRKPCRFCVGWLYEKLETRAEEMRFLVQKRDFTQFVLQASKHFFVGYREAAPIKLVLRLPEEASAARRLSARLTRDEARGR